ncbi:MAG: arginine deiminase [Oscillospiraceae bacterium]|nr:arginine deiminase [Oscillospiraceae bacterium]
MSICVKSEVQPLKKVLLQRPGCELEQLVPSSMAPLLFDDIPYLQGAQAEHDAFAGTLRQQGVEVVYLSELAAQTLAQSEALRQQFVADFIHRSGCMADSYSRELTQLLLDLPTARELVSKTMAGVRFSELPHPKDHRLAAIRSDRSHFVLDPIPNLYFTRDPFAVIGQGVSLHRMYSETRNRETIYSDYILHYHPDYAGKVPFYYTPSEPYSLEGGDILNLSAQAIAVGISQRTMPEAVERLARNIFSHKESQVRRVLAFDIPNTRAFMHLDTVMTQIDRDKFLIHPNILEHLQIYELTPNGGGNVKVRQRADCPERILAEALEVDEVKLVRCGGGDQIAAQREQWNDGSNALCIRPGTIIAYDRNYVTNAILEQEGIEVLKIPSGELSRGRGGPRCMSMPLLRQEA